MGRFNIKGLRGLTAADRDYAEQNYLRTIQGWYYLTDNEKDAFYRDDNFRMAMVDNNLSPQLNMEYFIGRKDNYTPDYYRQTLTDYLLGTRPSDPVAHDRRAWQDKLFGLDKENDGTQDFTYRRQQAEQRDWDAKHDELRGLTTQQLQQRVLDEIAKQREGFSDEQREAEEVQRREREEKLQYYRGLSGQQRDRLYANQLFESAFSDSDDWEILKNLHPSIRDEIYNNPRYNATFKKNPILDQGEIRDADEDYRTWQEKTAYAITRGLINAFTIVTPEYAKDSAGGLLGLASYLKGGKEGAIIGAMYGIASQNPWSILIQKEIGGFGLINVSSKLQEHDAATILDELHEKSNRIIKQEVADDMFNYVDASLSNRQNNPEWKTTLDKTWELFTENNPAWQTFKDKDFTQLTDDQKLRIIAQTQAITWKYGQDTAMQVLNDELNDIVSKGQGSSFLRSAEGAALKFVASKGEKMAVLSNWLGIVDDDTAWKALKYWDNVDKLGVLSQSAQEDIIYGTNTQAYRDFIAQGGTRDQWIEEQEATGDYKGYGISPNKRVRATGHQHDWLSYDGVLDAFEMSGYIADQASAQWALGKLTKWLNKPIGAESRKLNNYLLGKLGASPEARVAFQGRVSDFLTKAGGYGRAYYGSIPISVGYGMAAYDEVRQKGLESILGQINQEIDESPEYKAQEQAILDKYGIIDVSEVNAVQATQLREQIMGELNELRQSWVDVKRKEKAIDFARLKEEADDAYNMNFTLESMRNMGINLTYKSWLYKDATRAVRGGRIPLELPNFEKTLGKIGFKDTGKRLDQSILNTKYGSKFKQYVEDENGHLVRNTSRWRTSAETVNEIRKNVWGGFWSNYMDDVSVGFSAGFHLNDFNNYMDAKYNPDTYNDTSDLMGSFLAGVNEGADKMLDAQSFNDGFIGALGSFVSFNPAGSFGMIGGWKNFTHDANGKRLSKVEIANKFLGNPILGTMGMVQEEHRNIDSRLQGLNDMLAKQGVKLTDTASLLHWAAERKDSYDYGDFIDMKDANDGLGFSILYDLARLEDEGGKYGDIAKGFFEDLERLSKGGENITNEDITAFLGNPENRHLLDEHVSVNEEGELVQMDDEGKQLYAASQLQSNAQKLLDLNKKLRKNMANVKRAFGNYNINESAAIQLAYSLTMRDQWEDRLKSLNKKTADSESYSHEVNDDVTFRSRKFTEDRITQIDKKIAETEKEIATHQNRIDALQGVSMGRALKKATNTKGSLRDKYTTYRRQRASILDIAEQLAGNEQLETSKAALKGRKKALKDLKQQKKAAEKLLKDRPQRSEENPYAPAYDIDVLNEQQIMDLNPEQRANILFHPENFNKAQQQVVEDLIKKKQITNPDFLTDIRDAAVLYNRIQENNRTIDNIMSDRDNFNRYANTVAAKSLYLNTMRYFNSDEYKVTQRDSQSRTKVVNQMTTNDNNQKAIVNNVLKYLQEQVEQQNKEKRQNNTDYELDLTNVADVLQLFDQNTDGILKSLNEDEQVVLDTPNGVIDLINSTDNNTSVRDLLQQAIEANAKNETIIQERQQVVTVPEQTVTETPPTTQEEDAAPQEPETPVEGRYQVNPDVVIDGKTANAELGQTYSNLINDEEVNRREQSRLQTTADYLNGNLIASEYIEKMGYDVPETQEDTQRKANRISNRYKKYLTDTKPKTPKQGDTEGSGNNHVENTRRIQDIVDTIAVGYEGVNSSTIEFYNPLLWNSNSESIQQIKEIFRNLFGETGAARMEELLREYAERKPNERPNVYFVVPSAWHDSMKNLRGNNYELLRELPVVAVVEDSKGGLTMSLNGEQKTFTPIGLAPATSFNFESSTLGQHRTEPIRKAAIKEGVVQTDQIITDDNGKPVTSKILRINRVTPPSMKKGIFKTIADIALQKLGFNPTKGKAEDIFQGKDTGKETSLYTSFRDNFLSKLTKRKSEVKHKNGSKEVTSLYYEYPYEGSTRRIQIFTTPLQSTMIEFPAGMLPNGETTVSLFAAIQRKDGVVNNYLLSKSATDGSAMLKLLANRIQYVLDKNLQGEEAIIDSEGNLFIADQLSKDLTNAFSNVFNNGNNGTNYSIKVANTVTNEEFEGNQVPHMTISLEYGDKSAELIRIPVTAETLDNNSMMDIIRRFLFDGVDGMGTFRGESESGKINGLTWNVNYTDLANYEDALNNQEDNGNRAIVSKARALFDDGILSVSQESIPGVYPYLSAPFDTQGKPVISQQTANPDNAGDLAGNTGRAANATIQEGSGIADALKSGIDSTIKKILDYSRRKREEIKQRRQNQTKDSVKNHLSATTVAGIMYNSNFSEDSPYYYPSTMIGTDVDTFVRDFFATDEKGNFLFDKNAIDYSKYSTLSKEVLDEMVEGLNVLKQQILSRGETRIISEEVIADGTIKVKLQDGRTIEVPNTGHLDMMTVDSLGKIHIYDMKTFRNDEAFTDKVFKGYATQLNIYKNLMEQQYEVQIDSVHIIPITVDYPGPTEQNIYSQKDGKLYLNDSEFKLDNPQTSRIGMKTGVDTLIKDASSKVQDESSKQAETMLKAIGFTQEEIERLKRGDIDRTLNRKKMTSQYTVSLQIPTTGEIILDFENMSEASKAKVNAIIEQLQKENGEQNTSQIASMKVNAPERTGIVINSDLEINNNQQTPDTAAPFVGQTKIGETGQTITEKKEEIDDTASCRMATPAKGVSGSSKRGRNIRF